MGTLRRDILAICIALIALVSQMFFGVVHATSIWMASAGPVAQVEAGSTAYNFLQICSAGGLVTLDGDEDNSGEFDPSRCPVCSSAAASPMLEGDQPALVPVCEASIVLSVSKPHQIHALSFKQVVYARGPPAFS